MNNTLIVCNAENKPSIAKEGDAGIDLIYNGKEEIKLRPSTVYKIPTSTFVQIPKGKCGIVFERSGNGLKGWHILGRVIDSGYRGEIGVILSRYAFQMVDVADNFKTLPIPDDVVIKPGTKVAQMVIVDCHPSIEYVQNVECFDKSERGDTGFGSSDKK